MPSDEASKDEAVAESFATAGFFRSGLELIDRTVGLAVIVCMACLVVIVSTQVVLRYFFNTSLDWAWEASRLSFVASIFLAIPLALKEGGHVGIDVVLPHLPSRLRRAVLVLRHLVMMFLMIVVAVVGFQATRSTWDQVMSSLPISTGWFYVPVIIASVHCVLHLIDQTARVLLDRPRPSPGTLGP